MTYLVNHAARFRSVLALDHVMHAAQTEALDGGAHIVGARDGTNHPLDLDGAALFGLFVLADHVLLAKMMAPDFLTGLPCRTFTPATFRS